MHIRILYAIGAQGLFSDQVRHTKPCIRGVALLNVSVHCRRILYLIRRLCTDRCRVFHSFRVCTPVASGPPWTSFLLQRWLTCEAGRSVDVQDRFLLFARQNVLSYICSFLPSFTDLTLCFQSPVQIFILTLCVQRASRVDSQVACLVWRAHLRLSMNCLPAHIVRIYICIIVDLSPQNVLGLDWRLAGRVFVPWHHLVRVW